MHRSQGSRLHSRYYVVHIHALDWYFFFDGFMINTMSKSISAILNWLCEHMLIDQGNTSVLNTIFISMQSSNRNLFIVSIGATQTFTHNINDTLFGTEYILQLLDFVCSMQVWHFQCTLRCVILIDSVSWLLVVSKATWLLIVKFQTLSTTFESMILVKFRWIFQRIWRLERFNSCR